MDPTTILVALLSGGLVTALADLLRQRRERKAADVRAPHEIEQIVADGARVAVDSIVESLRAAEARGERAEQRAERAEERATTLAEQVEEDRARARWREDELARELARTRSDLAAALARVDACEAELATLRTETAP